MEIAKRNRLNLLALARKHEAKAIAKARLAMQPEREAGLHFTKASDSRYSERPYGRSQHRRRAAFERAEQD